MQLSLDGFAGAGGASTDFNWGAEAHEFSIANLQNVDTLLLGRATAEGFIPHWRGVAADPSLKDHAFGKAVMAIPRVVFSNSIARDKWEGTTVIGGDFVKGIQRLKEKDGGEILVYGGTSFAASLIGHRLVDELYFLVNPVAIGHGEAVFYLLEKKLELELRECRPFKSGQVMLHYRARI